MLMTDSQLALFGTGVSVKIDLPFEDFPKLQDHQDMGVARTVLAKNWIADGLSDTMSLVTEDPE